MHPALYDPNVTVYPKPDLPPDEELRQVQVCLSYAEDNPYVDLNLQLSGDLVTVSHWLDQHVEPFYAVIRGFCYTQGASIDGIKRQLLKGGVQPFGDVLYCVSRTSRSLDGLSTE